MNIYKLKRTDKLSYDEYDSGIVCAESEEEAKLINISNPDYKWVDNKWIYVREDGSICETDGWSWVDADKLNVIKVTLLGIADKDIKKGVILASFNAG